MLLIILLILAVLFLAGGYSYRSTYGTWGYSPVLLIVVIALILWALGYLR